MKTAGCFRLGLLLLPLVLATPARAEELAVLQAMFLRGDYSTVVREARNMDRQGRELSDGALYLWGICALKLEDAQEGRQALQRLMSQYPSSRWRAPSWLALGQSWEEEGKDEEALKVYGQLLEEQKTGPYSGQAVLRMAKAQMRLGQWEESRTTLEQLVRGAPGSPEAAAAREMLQQGTFYYCVQVGAFSSEENAQRLAGELKRRGYVSEISEGSLQGKTFYRVRVGRFNSHGEAEGELQKLRQEGFPGRIFP